MSRLATLKPRVQAAIKNRVSIASQLPTYRIRGREGQRLRAQSLTATPLCAMCMKQGIITVAIESDHIVPLIKGGRETLENRQGLCRECHVIKGKEDNASTALRLAK